MSLSTTVKVGNITNLSDARYCAGMGVSLLGFPVDTALPFHLTPETFKEISGWVSGVSVVGEIVNRIPADYAVDLIQFHDSSLIDEVHKSEIPYIFTINLDTMDPPEIQEIAKDAHPEFYLLETSASDISGIGKLHLNAPVMLGYCESVEDADRYIQAGSDGIALLGSHEEKPGFKDYDQMADILEHLEID